MAVTIDRGMLSNALRLGNAPDEMAEALRLLEYATEAVTKYAPHAPDVAHNEAAIRLAGYLYDAPGSFARTGYSRALANSGAASILLPYRVHRMGKAEAVAEAQAAVGTPGNPVTNVSVEESTLTVTFADGSEEEYPIAAPAADVFDWAEEGNEDPIPADKLTNAPGGPAQIVNAPGGRLPAEDVVMRIGWGQTQDVTDAKFTRADNHPTDGASVGTVAGLNPPVFPPALNTETGLYMFVWIEAEPGQVADILLSSGGGTLIGSGLALAAYVYDGAPGTVWVSNQRLSASLANFTVSAIVQGALILTGADVFDWAETGNEDPIPASKLAEAGGAAADQTARDAAAAAQATADAAQTEAEVQALVSAGVEDWAEDGNADPIPAAKLANAPGGGTPYVLPAAAPGVRGGVQAVTSAIVDTGTSTGIFGWAIAHVRRVVNAIVPTWARTGDATPIPAAKLTEAPGGGFAPTITTGTMNGVVNSGVDGTSTGFVMPETGVGILIVHGVANLTGILIFDCAALTNTLTGMGTTNRGAYSGRIHSTENRLLQIQHSGISADPTTALNLTLMIL